MNAARPPRTSDDQLRNALTRRSDPERMAEDLAVIFATVERTRQRRWLSARLTGAAPWTRSTAILLAVLAMLVALGVVLTVFVGSRHRLPPPFGLARPGALVVETGGHIGVMRPDGTGLAILTSGPPTDSYPLWSPDGTKFAFASYQNFSYALIVMDSDGGHRITLADGLLGGVWIGGGAWFGPAIGLSWSPDSQRIVFSARIGDAPEQQIYVTDADRPNAARIGRSDVYGVSPSWSPNGSLIAFKRIYRCCGGPPDSLSLISADGSNLHQLSGATGTKEGLMGTAWSPDGTRLAFLASGTDQNNDILVINADGMGERNITHSLDDEFWPSWSPDGTRIAFSRVQLGSSLLGTGLFVVGADGANLVQVPTGSAAVSNPLWSPDGSRILGYVDHGFGGADFLAVLDPIGRNPPVDIPLPGAGSASWQRLAP